MPAQPHVISADVDNLVTFLVALPAAGRGQNQQGGQAPAARGGRGGAAAGSGAPPELVVGSGSVATIQTGGGRGRGAVRYTDDVPQTEQYVINEYNTVGNRIKPPYTSIVNTTSISLTSNGASASATILRLLHVASPGQAPQDCSTASLSPRRVLYSAPDATTRFARGIATQANNCGPPGLAATSWAHR